MAGFKLTISGIEEVTKKLDYSKYKTEIQKSFDKFGLNAATEAKQFAPVDEGHLRSAIYSKPLELSVEIGCAVSYAAYLEFGTRKFAADYVNSLPPTWQAYATGFKGKGGGDYNEFLNAILDWVIRKGIAARYSVKTQEPIKVNLKKPSSGAVGKSDYERLHDTAYAIALYIIRNGIKPHPFLYPAINGQHYEILLKELKEITPG